MSLVQGRRQRRELVKSLDRDEEKRHRKAIALLLAAHTAAKKERREELRRAKQRCHDGARVAADAARAKYHAARASAEKAWDAEKAARIAARDATRAAARSSCELDRDHVNAESTHRIDALEQKSAKLRAHKLENRSRDGDPKKRQRAEQRQRAELRALDEQIEREKKKRRGALNKAKHTCKNMARAASDLARSRYQEARAASLVAWQLRKEARIAERRATRKAAVDSCELDRCHVKKEAAHKLSAIALKLEENRKHSREMASIARINKGRDKERKKTSALERRQESDDEVVSNIPESLVHFWEKVKRGIKGTDRRSRTEHFIEYAAENRDAVIQLNQEIADREVQKLERQYLAQQREQKKQRRQEADADIPF